MRRAARCGGRRPRRSATRVRPMLRGMDRDTARFEHAAHGIEVNLLHVCRDGRPHQDLPPEDAQHLTEPAATFDHRLCRMGARNFARGLGAVHSDRARSRARGALFARNPWDAAFGSRVAFADLAGRQSQWTADRGEFLGRHGTLEMPAALASRTPLVRPHRRRPRSVLRTADVDVAAARSDHRGGFLPGRSRRRGGRAVAAHPLPQRRSRRGLSRGHRALGARSRRGAGENAGPVPGHHPQSLDALSGARLPHLGAHARSIRPAAHTAFATSFRTEWRLPSRGRT